MINSPSHLCLSKSFPVLWRSHALSTSQFSKLKPLLSPLKTRGYNGLHRVFHTEFLRISFFLHDLETDG